MLIMFSLEAREMAPPTVRLGLVTSAQSRTPHPHRHVQRFVILERHPRLPIIPLSTVTWLIQHFLPSHIPLSPLVTHRVSPVGSQSRQQKRRRSPCSLLQKACRVALPLQLLLLLFLLLLFLLPAGQEERSCALANNFARSFALMLRYNGPPPT